MSKQQTQAKIEDYIGKRIGISVVIGLDEEAKKKNLTKWIMKCDCGNIYTESPCRIVEGHKQSCGCYRYTNKIKHGMSYNKFFDIWYDIMKRCYDKKIKGYENYGGRGIDVDNEWHDVKNFVKWAEETYPKDGGKYSIDRIDNNASYSKNNCRWATRKEQQRNRRNTIYYEINGEKKPLVEWCEIYKINYTLVYYRIKCGWNVERALTEPVHKKHCETKDNS